MAFLQTANQKEGSNFVIILQSGKSVTALQTTVLASAGQTSGWRVQSQIEPNPNLGFLPDLNDGQSSPRTTLRLKLPDV